MTVVRFREWARPRAFVIALVVAAVAQVAYQLGGAATFLPRFRSEDPRQVVTAYYEAQRWGFRTFAEQALDPEEREALYAANAVRPLIGDAFCASDLEVSPAKDIPLYGEHAEERQFVVTYHSKWRSSVGDAPGERMWFVYVGRDDDGLWRVLSEGTGP